MGRGFAKQSKCHVTETRGGGEVKVEWEKVALIGFRTRESGHRSGQYSAKI